MIDETFLTTEEVLEYLQVNLRTVYRLIKAGKIPAVRVGRQWRFRKRDIDARLETQRPHPEGVPAFHVATGSGRKRVLVVDDEESIRELLSKTLELADYDVETAGDASTAPPAHWAVRLNSSRLEAFDVRLSALTERQAAGA